MKIKRLFADKGGGKTSDIHEQALNMLVGFKWKKDRSTFSCFKYVCMYVVCLYVNM